MSDEGENSKRLFFIDTDAGLDDAQAILMALAQPNIEVIGISTVQGNAACPQVVENVLRLLEVAGRLDVPVYKGSELSLLGGRCDASFYHGRDGFGEVQHTKTVNTSLVQSDHAVTALLNVANSRPGEITLIALGPLTNLALAIRMDPKFGSKLKHCYIMGGNYEGKGNITASAEFNFHSDPEAAHIVLNELGCPITLACWELCIKYALSWDHYEHMISAQTPKANMLREIERKVLDAAKLENKKFKLADQFAMAAAIRPEAVTKAGSFSVDVELEGKHSRGLMIVDWLGKWNNSRHITVILQLDMDIVCQLVKESVQ